MRRFFHLLARISPGAYSARVWLHRKRGVKIDGRVFIGADVFIDEEHPDYVTIHDNSVLSIRVIVIAHFQSTPQPVEIGPDAFIGPGAIIMPGVRIGRGCVVAAGSVVSKSVPDFTFVGGMSEAKPLARVTSPIGISGKMEDFLRGLRPIRRP